jgi:excisionase family DNA binding protein
MGRREARKQGHLGFAKRQRNDYDVNVLEHQPARRFRSGKQRTPESEGSPAFVRGSGMASTQYSSFQIAKMLDVSRQAVNQWIDKGYIESYRTPGGHRRVARRSLVAFLHTRNYPIPRELASPDPQDARKQSLDIIMIDDDVDFLILVEQAMKEVLPQAGVRKFSNGLDGLIAIGVKRPDLLLVDMRMPDLDGAEVIKRLKTNIHTNSLPIIVITAYDELPTVQALRKLRVEQVIAKSKPLEEIVQEIGRFVDRLRQVAAE